MSQQKGEDNAVTVVRRALDLGINFIDTAEAYGTEGVVGRALREAGARDNVVISTKPGSSGNGPRRRPASARRSGKRVRILPG
jgi:aryl-alcohol dehydrogenase-like predicted oxidoreductase